MKRRKNTTLKENLNVQQTPKPKRSRSQQNDENINPNQQNHLDTSDVQVKGIFDRLMVGISNIPSQARSTLSPLTETGPSSSTYMPQETIGMLTWFCKTDHLLMKLTMLAQ